MAGESRQTTVGVDRASERSYIHTVHRARGPEIACNIHRDQVQMKSSENSHGEKVYVLYGCWDGDADIVPTLSRIRCNNRDPKERRLGEEAGVA